jgi:molybdenum cofactor biosynthesis protein MoaC
MLDISHKSKTLREATATATVKMQPSTVQRAAKGDTPKGNPLEVARVAATQAAKNTSSIIPYCHPLPVDFVGVEYEIGEHSITVSITVKAIYKTGVEMEALTAASVAALTLYDMLKMIDNSLVITEVRLISKRGGKSNFSEELKRPIRAAVLVMSDSISKGRKSDRSGKLIVERLQREGIEIMHYQVVPDDADIIADAVRGWCDSGGLDLIVTTGGTGLSPRDCTPEAMCPLFEREIPGIPEAMRAYGQERTPYSMLSRSTAGIRGETIIINFPGSTMGVAESLEAVFPALKHAFNMLWAGEHSPAKDPV